MARSPKNIHGVRIQSIGHRLSLPNRIEIGGGFAEDTSRRIHSIGVRERDVAVRGRDLLFNRIRDDAPV